MADVKIELYRWAGAWGPFKINIPCGECSLTRDILKDTFKRELTGIPLELELKEIELGAGRRPTFRIKRILTGH